MFLGKTQNQDSDKVQEITGRRSNTQTSTTLPQVAHFLSTFYQELQPECSTPHMTYFSTPALYLVPGGHGSLQKRWNESTILVSNHPDPQRQFILEGEASDLDIDSVLPKRLDSNSKLLLCAFFSHLLAPAKQNFRVGNRTLLVVKLSLEEWRHLSEQAVRSHHS